MPEARRPLETHRAARIVVGLAGAMGAGKTCGARHLSETFGYSYIRYSQILSEWLPRSSPTKDVLQTFGWEIMNGDRQRELNERLISRIDENKCWVVDGLRHRIDFDMLNSRFPERFFLLFIDANGGVRWERIKSNGRLTDADAFGVADTHRVEQPLRKLAGMAFDVIPNEASFDQYKIRLDESIRNIRASMAGNQ